MNYNLSDNELRQICKEKIESLEFWLRRLIDEILTEAYRDYFTFQDANGNFLFGSAIRKAISKRKEVEPERYPRMIDAVLFNDSIDIICHPNLYKKHFAAALVEAFPDGREEAKTFLERLVEPRNRLGCTHPPRRLIPNFSTPLKSVLPLV